MRYQPGVQLLDAASANFPVPGNSVTSGANCQGHAEGPSVDIQPLKMVALPKPDGISIRYPFSGFAMGLAPDCAW
jgi:hypothetical protein